MKDVVVAAAPEQQVVHADVALVGGDGVVVVVHADAPHVAAVNCSEHFVTIELELVVAVVVFKHSSSKHCFSCSFFKKVFRTSSKP